MAGLPLACLTQAGFASVMHGTTHLIRLPVPLPPQDSSSWQSPLRAFAWGVRSVASTVLTLVLFATYLGIGALAHDTHFSLGWVLAGTALVWAGPAQIILISTLGSGATVVLVTHFIAVTLWVECFRLLPKVPRERRVAFTLGLGTGLVCVCLVANAIGYGLAANLPQLFAAAVLLLTPLTFLLSTARNCRQLSDILA